MVRHDAQRPETQHFVTDTPVPGHWIQVLATMRANTFTRLSIDEVRAEAAHILIVSPTAEVARTCFAELLDSGAQDGVVEIITAEAAVPENVPAGTWVFLPHQQDGWTELETASARLRAALVKENSGRARAERLTLIEYGVNLWLWAEPPYAGGDPVCHAGELISWESAWALSGPSASERPDGGEGAAAADAELAGEARSARPPIYFGLPPILRERRMDG